MPHSTTPYAARINSEIIRNLFFSSSKVNSPMGYLASKMF